MKLSFSTNRWKDISFPAFVRMAADYRFDGIEVHSVGELGQDLSAAFRLLTENRLSVPCLDLVGDVGDRQAAAENMRELLACLKAARKLRIPYIRIRASRQEGADEAVKRFLPGALEEAARDGVILLIETVGLYADTAHLRELLNDFASDSLGAVWDLCYPYLENGETPQQTITNLGAYVKHVHAKDADENGQFTLVGEGKLPLKDFIRALGSVNFAGFVCLEWDPEWISDLNDVHVIFPHYQTYMSHLEDTKRNSATLYENRAGTGKFVWKKDVLIEKTFSQVLDAMCENFPDQYAFKYTTLDYTRTYSQFRDDVDTFARSLVAMGVRAGSHVAIWSSNLPQWYIAFWATTKIGAVLVTVNTAYKIHEAEYLLKQSDTHTLIMERGSRDSHYDQIMDELCPELADVPAGRQLHAKRLPFLRNIITLGYRQKGCLTWEDALQMSHRVPQEEIKRMADAVSVHDVCNMQYTSGTTGFPKGVMLTHYNIVNNGKCIGDRMDLSTADRMMVQVPMFHCFGMVLAMTASMTHGTTLQPLPYFSAKAALACIHNEHITAFHGVPTMFIAMLEHPDFPGTDFSYMRTGIMAGSPCPISVMKDVVEKMNMREITIVYGQTEASPGCTMSSTDDPLEVRVTTVGRAMPEIECRIVDPETGEDLPDNVTGEFIARGYNIMKGYYKMPLATAAAIDRDGWLHTGDLACRTPEGNFKITGRLKDMIIRGGENIYPKEIEEFLYTHPKISDVQVIGVPDEQYGEEILAAVILKEGEQMTEDELKQFVLAHMAKHKVPKYVDFVSEFPMNVAGKILKYKMREDAVQRHGLQKAAGVVTA